MKQDYCKIIYIYIIIDQLFNQIDCIKSIISDRSKKLICSDSRI